VNEAAMEKVSAFAAQSTTREEVDEVRAFTQLLSQFRVISSNTYDEVLIERVNNKPHNNNGSGSGGSRRPQTRQIPRALQDVLLLQKFSIINIIAINKIYKKTDKWFRSEIELLGMKALVQTPLCTMPDLLESLLTKLQAALVRRLPTADEFECAICLEIFHNPITLPCQHTFCSLCLKQIHKTGASQCPMCRQECPLSPSKLERNTILADQVSAFFPQETKAKAKTEEMQMKKIARQRFMAKLENMTSLLKH
jgi:hypothetical protein